MASGRLEEIARGAEAVLFRTQWFKYEAIVKVRLPKPYRHAEYDKLFRYRRTVTEARVLATLKRLGLNVPAVFYVDPDNSFIVLEYIRGSRLSDVVNEIDLETLKKIAYSLGEQVCIMHKNGVYHGDLTIANIIIHGNNTAYLVDFGLAGYSRDIEEYAIDVHLLSRGLTALSPDRHDVFMEKFREGYSRVCGEEFTNKVFERMREIRLRGRYVEERLLRRVSLDRYM